MRRVLARGLFERHDAQSLGASGLVVEHSRNANRLQKSDLGGRPSGAGLATYRDSGADLLAKTAKDRWVNCAATPSLGKG